MAGGKRVIDSRFHLENAVMVRHDFFLGGLRAYKYLWSASLFSNILFSYCARAIIPIFLCLQILDRIFDVFC